MELYDEWGRITRGEISYPSRIIAARFGASYVFSDLGHKNFLDAANENPGLVEIYRDPYAVIFEITRWGFSQLRRLAESGNNIDLQEDCSTYKKSLCWSFPTAQLQRPQHLAISPLCDTIRRVKSSL